MTKVFVNATGFYAADGKELPQGVEVDVDDRTLYVGTKTGKLKLVNNDEGSGEIKPKTAKEVIADIRQVTNLDDLEQYAGEERASVIEALEKKEAELLDSE